MVKTTRENDEPSLLRGYRYWVRFQHESDEALTVMYMTQLHGFSNGLIEKQHSKFRDIETQCNTLSPQYADACKALDMLETEIAAVTMSLRAAKGRRPLQAREAPLAGVGGDHSLAVAVHRTARRQRAKGVVSSRDQISEEERELKARLRELYSKAKPLKDIRKSLRPPKDQLKTVYTGVNARYKERVKHGDYRDPHGNGFPSWADATRALGCSNVEHALETIVASAKHGPPDFRHLHKRLDGGMLSLTWRFTASDSFFDGSTAPCTHYKGSHVARKKLREPSDYYALDNCPTCRGTGFKAPPGLPRRALFDGSSDKVRIWPLKNVVCRDEILPASDLSPADWDDLLPKDKRALKGTHMTWCLPGDEQVKLDAVMHRPLPVDALIRKAHLGYEKVGQHRLWHVSFLVESVAHLPQVPVGRSGTIAVDLGMGRRLEDNVSGHVGHRTAFMVNSRGEAIDVTVSRKVVQAIEYAGVIRARRQVAFDETVRHLIAQIDGLAEVPVWLQDQRSHMQQWKGMARGRNLHDAWSKARFDGDGTAFDTLVTWDARERELYDEESALVSGAYGMRDDVLQRFAKHIALTHDVIVLEGDEDGKPLDLRPLIAKKPVEDADDSDGRAKRRVASMAAPGVFREYLIAAAAKFGTKVVYINCRNSSRTCDCGDVVHTGFPADLMKTCDKCHQTFERDIQACRNLLRWYLGSPGCSQLVNTPKSLYEVLNIPTPKTREEKHRHSREQTTRNRLAKTAS